MPSLPGLRCFFYIYPAPRRWALICRPSGADFSLTRGPYFGFVESGDAAGFLSLSASLGGGFKPRVDMRSSVLTLSPSVVLFVDVNFFGFVDDFFVLLLVC